MALYVYDQNRDGLEHWTDVIFGDPETAPFVAGVAVHWYESTYKVYEDVLERVHEKFPRMSILHTEGTIDDLVQMTAPFAWLFARLPEEILLNLRVAHQARPEDLTRVEGIGPHGTGDRE